MKAELRLRLPRSVLYRPKMRGEGKILLGAMYQIAGSDRVVQATKIELGHLAWMSERAVARWLTKFSDAGLVADYEHAAGCVLLRLTPPDRASWAELAIPHSLMAWPNLRGEPQLGWSILSRRLGRSRRGWITHSELSWGVTATNQAAAGRRTLRALAKVGLVKVLQSFGAPRGESEVEIDDPDQVWQRHAAAVRRNYRRRSA